MKKTSHLLAVLAALSACTVTVDEGNPPPRPRPEPGFCPKIYAPVCAEGRGARHTFPNDCVAAANGFRVISDGQCRRDVPPPISGGVVCPTNYLPVCARQGGVLRTFQNGCVATASGFNIIDNGEC